MQSFDELADEVSSIESRVSDAIYDALRAQVNADEPEKAKDVDRRLSKVRRILQKADALLRGASAD